MPWRLYSWVAREGLMHVRPWRQVGCGVADRLDAGLLVIGDDGDVRYLRRRSPSGGDFAIDAEHLSHLRLERVIAPFKIVADLVRLGIVGGEELADRALDDTGQGRMPGRRGMLADMAGQQPRCRDADCRRGPPSPQAAPHVAGSAARCDGSPRSSRPPQSSRGRRGRPAGCAHARPGLPVRSATATAPPNAPDRQG